MIHMLRFYKFLLLLHYMLFIYNPPPHNHKATVNQQPKAYKATRLQIHRHIKSNYLQANKHTTCNSQQPATNIQHTFKSQQPPSTMYEQEPCKASCVLLAAGRLAQGAFGVNSHPSSIEDPMHHPQFTSPPFHTQFKTNRQQPPASNQTHTKSQGYKSTSLQSAITYKPTNTQQPAASSQQPTHYIHPGAITNWLSV